MTRAWQYSKKMEMAAILTLFGVDSATLVIWAVRLPSPGRCSRQAVGAALAANAKLTREPWNSRLRRSHASLRFATEARPVRQPLLQARSLTMFD